MIYLSFVSQPASQSASKQASIYTLSRGRDEAWVLDLLFCIRFWLRELLCDLLLFLPFILLLFGIFVSSSVRLVEYLRAIHT